MSPFMVLLAARWYKNDWYNACVHQFVPVIFVPISEQILVRFISFQADFSVVGHDNCVMVPVGKP
jgi:hypothetical protein